MPPPIKHSRSDSQIVFPAPIPPGINPDGPIESDYSPLVRTALSTNHMPVWCGVLIDRVCRFADNEEPAFVHMRLLVAPIAGADQVLVGHAYVTRDRARIAQLSQISEEQVLMLTTEPSANCYGMAITGPGANYCVSRMEIGTPLAVLRRKAETSWPTGKSLLLTSGWGPPASEMGPLLREQVVPHLGLDPQAWWEWSDGIGP